MAVVNRFSKGPRVNNLINPISFQELAITPSYMREQHDLTEEMAIQNSIYQIDALSQDMEAADRQYAKLVDDTDAMTSELAKTGWSTGKKSELLALMKERADLDKNVKRPLEARKAAYLAEVERIKEFYKDSPQAANATLQRLAQANKAAASVDPETGKMNVPGIQDVYYSKIFSSQEKAELADTMFNSLKERMVQDAKTGKFPGLDPVAISNLDNFTQLYTFVDNYKGVGADRIAGYFQSVIGQDSDLYKGFVTELLNEGIENPELANRYKASLIQQMGQGDMTEKTLENAEAIMGMSPRQLADFLARTKVGEFITGSAENLAFDEFSYDRVKNTDELRLHAAKRMSDKLAAIDDSLAAQEIGFDNRSNPILNRFGDFEDLSFDANGKLVPTPSALPKTLREGTPVTHNLLDQYIFKDAEGNEVAYGEAMTSGSKAPGEYGAPTYNIKKGYTAERVASDADLNYNKTSKIFAELRKESPEFAGMTDKQLSARMQKLIEQQKGSIETGVFSMDDTGDKFSGVYLGNASTIDGEIVVELGTIADKTNYSLNDGAADKTLYAVAEELGYDNINDFIVNAGLSKPVFSPRLGKFVVRASSQDKEETRNIFIEPEQTLRNLNAPISEAHDNVMSLKGFAPVKSGTNAAQGKYSYTYTDFNTGKSYFIMADKEITTKQDAVRYMVANDGTDRIMDMTDFTNTYFSRNVAKSKAFRNHITIED